MDGWCNMSNKVVIINGNGGCGKDTFVRMIQKINPSVENISTIDSVKEIAKKMNWTGDKSEQGRKFLSDLKRLWDDYNCGATDAAVKKVNSHIRMMNSYDLDGLVFVHCREPENIELLKVKLSQYEIITLLITNKNVKLILSNPSDANVENFGYDYVISNDGTLEELQEKAVLFYNTYLKENA